MLKLYKTTIIASTFAALTACIISIICECIQFPHSSLLQNYAVGISCSLVVVVITTVLQYLHEHKKVFDAYCNSLQRLMFAISFCFPQKDGEEDLSDEYYNYIFDLVDTSLKVAGDRNQELLWFSRKKRKLQEEVSKCYAHLWIDFERPRFESKRACIAALENHPKYVPLIKACIDIFPNDYDKDSIKKTYKDIL